MNLIVHPFRSMTWIETISSRTSCLVIWHGSRWYTILYYYALQLTDMSIQDTIAEDPEIHGSMFVPIILGSDKTTVSVGTGNNEYYPLYMSTSNIHNNTCHAHCNGVVLVEFLAIPKSKISVLYSEFYLIFLPSWQKGCGWSKVLKIPPLALPLITSTHTCITQTCDDKTWSCPLSRWTLSTCYLWSGTLHCRLPWTSASRMHCPRMVP